MKNRVLIFTSYYHPCVKGGGPIRSVKNLVDNLTDRIDFYIVTGDRDLGDYNPMKNVATESWSQVESAKVYYTDKNNLSLKKVIKLINSVNCDVIYLNSFFSYKFSISIILLNRLGKLSDKRIVIAPRGEFSEGALGLKVFKKKLYIMLAKRFRLYKNVKWHATTEYEMNDIKKVFAETVEVDVAKNLTANYQNIEYSKLTTKIPGELKLVYVSRIHPMKNLLQTLDIIKKLEGKVSFDIFGPIEDSQYWQKCNQVIISMPINIKVKYNGLIQNDKLQELYKNQHCFILLTLGENFGHAISEALIGGCPVVISDRTPWKNLEKSQIGWDIPLDDESKITRVLNTLIGQNDEEYKMLSKNAFEYSKTKVNQDEDLNTYYTMLTR